jgi:hypothetical protein
METSFARVIDEHLELKRRNESGMSRELTQAGRSGEASPVASAATASEGAPPSGPDYEDSLWGRAREFEWGD